MLNSDKNHLSFKVKRKYVKMTLYKQFQISMTFSAGYCLNFVTVLTLCLCIFLIGILTRQVLR